MCSHMNYIFEVHFTPDQIYIYPSCQRNVKRNCITLPGESASSTIKHRSVNAIKKREEYQLLQDQMS